MRQGQALKAAPYIWSGFPSGNVLTDVELEPCSLSLKVYVLLHKSVFMSSVSGNGLYFRWGSPPVLWNVVGILVDDLNLLLEYLNLSNSHKKLYLLPTAQCTIQAWSIKVLDVLKIDEQNIVWRWDTLWAS